MNKEDQTLSLIADMLGDDPYDVDADTDTLLDEEWDGGEDVFAELG
ncbi:MAG: hypothetical protein AAGA70_05650 [Pseudomonadota bacterium]